MIRVTIDLHVISKGDEGGFWLSTLSKCAWEGYKKKYTWCDENDGLLRDELRERFGEQFMLVREGDNPSQVISARIGFGAQVSIVIGWPTKIKLEEELNA